jgi:hypothetical protein
MLNVFTSKDIKLASVRVRGAHDKHRAQVIEKAMDVVVKLGFYSDNKIEMKYGKKNSARPPIGG